MAKSVVCGDIDLELGSPAEIAVLSALNPKLDAIDVAGCDAIFDLLDLNGNGRLSFDEMREGVRSDAVIAAQTTQATAHRRAAADIQKPRRAQGSERERIDMRER